VICQKVFLQGSEAIKKSVRRKVHLRSYHQLLSNRACVA
jgi:hypothetical protein